MVVLHFFAACFHKLRVLLPSGPERRPPCGATAAGRTGVEGERRDMVHFSTCDAAMRWYREQLEVGTVIESGTYEVWRVEQPRQVEGLGHALAKLIAV